jgi:RNA polymerase sigma-70 factor (ECF subfamily)
MSSFFRLLKSREMGRAARTTDGLGRARIPYRISHVTFAWPARMTDHHRRMVPKSSASGHGGLSLSEKLNLSWVSLVPSIGRIQREMATAAAGAIWNVTGSAWSTTITANTVKDRLDPDYTIVERCLSGDAAAWEELVRLHTRRVYGLCYRFTGREAEAQDLTQDVFLRVFRALGSFRSTEGSFTTWLARLTRNLLIDHYRRTRNERVTDSIEEQLPRIEGGRTGDGVSAPKRPDSAVAGREASELLQGALGKLSPELRETIILRDLQEMEYREIAEVLAIPEGTVKSRLNRGRAELARLLKKYRVAV